VVPSSDFQQSLAQGQRHFVAGRYFEAHEAWEDGWRVTKGGEKQLLQVLVLWAAAFHHQGKANRKGALIVMARALEKLGPIAKPPFDTEPLREALVESWERLTREGAEPPVPPAWDPAPAQAPQDTLELTHRTRCPYCGEQVAIEVEPELSRGAQYVEDCPVCCNPWSVSVRDEGGRVAIALQRSDD